ncbi:MAG: polysaccharide deacetylase family protein [Nitrospirota bacterium]
MKRVVKSMAAAVGYHSGALNLVQQWHRRTNPDRALTVVGYHRVTKDIHADEDSAPLGMFVTEETFARQIEFLSARYRILGLPELQALCDAQRPLPPRACLITFDDGWRDNYTLAFPILRARSIPAVVLVATDYVGTEKPFWYSRLIRLLRRGRRSRVTADLLRDMSLPDAVRSELLTLGRIEGDLSARAIEPLIGLMSSLQMGTIDRLVAFLAQHLGEDQGARSDERLMLNWEELGEMACGGITVGSKTCALPMLTTLTAEQARFELEESKRVIEGRLGVPVLSFVFPHGAYTDALLTLAWDVGYRVVFLSSPRTPPAGKGRVFRCLCVHEGVSTGPDGRFSPGLFALGLSRVDELLARR